jgi:hypothetical protein
MLKPSPPATISGRVMKTFAGIRMLRHVRGWYVRYERPISSASLVGGFVFDALTLHRVDTFWENLWVVVHLLVVAACIVLVNREENEAAHGKDSPRARFWLVNLLQLFYGGLLSTLLVFYFRSGGLSASWPFLLVLAVAFAANESLKKHYARLGFQISLFYLSLFCFTIFIVPVLVHAMGPLVFVLSGAVRLLLVALFLRVLEAFSKETMSRGRREVSISILAIFLGVNALYFLNLIPPIPLSLLDARVYHSIAKDPKGGYQAQSEERGWLGFLRWTDTIHLPTSGTAYAYSAVFSPTSLDTRIVHDWQRYDEKRGWVTVSRVELPLVGGRGGGYRTYSIKTQMSPGAWRVNVETPRGALLGRLRFNVAAEAGAPALRSEFKD